MKAIYIVCVIALLGAMMVAPAAATDWSAFQKDKHNTGLTSDKAPITNPYGNGISWERSFAANFDEAPVVVGDMVYVVGADNKVRAMNKTDGFVKWETSTSGGGFLLGNMGAGNGTIFVPTSDGKIFGIDDANGVVGWSATESGQMNTPVVYDDHKIYFGDWDGNKAYYCYSDTGTEIWQRTSESGSGYYWAGAATIGDYLVYGDDAGHLTSVYKANGTTVHEIDVSTEFSVTANEIRSSICYVENLDRIYFTSKGGYIYALGMNNDGTFDTTDKHYAYIGYSTSTPAVYNNKVYVGAGGMYGGGSGVSCLDADLTDEDWHFVAAAGAVQSSPAITTAYDDGDGEVYIYVTTNTAAGKVYCVNESGVEQWSWGESGKTDWTLCGVAISDGWIFYGTDNTYVFGFATTESLFGSTPTSVTPFLISGSVSYDNGNPVLNPMVTVTNLATSEDFTVKTDAGSNYYLTLTDSTHITAGDTIRIIASDGTASSETDHLVIASDLETGGFVQDMTIESGNRPDLTVTEKSEEWVSLTDGTYNVTYTIENIGNSGADASTTAIEIDGTEVATNPVPALAIGESHTSTLGPFMLSGENDTIRVCADSGEIINELNETNNCLENVLEAPSMPDLIVWVALKTPGYVNEDNILGVRVKNTGTVDAGSFSISLAIDGTQMPEQTVTQLAEGETTELEYAWMPTELGTHLLSATVDTGNDVSESNETNNDFARTLVIIKRTDWHQFHYDGVHSGFSPSGAPDTNETLWISDELSAIGGTSTVVADGKVFAYGGPTSPYGSGEGVLYGLDEFTGAIIWNISIPTPAFGSWSSPAYHNGRVFTSTDIETGCYDAATGEQIWAFENPTNGPSVNGGPVVADGKVIVNDWQAGHYYCLDEETGELLWTFTEEQTGDWNVGYTQGVPAYEDGKFYLTTWLYVGGNVYCLDADTGENIWNQTTPLDTCGSPTVVDGTVYVTNYNFEGYGEIYAMNATNGSILWHKAIQRSDSTPAVAYGNVYVTGGCLGYSDRQTYCFNATNGNLTWSTDTADAIGAWTCSVAVADGKVFAGTEGGDSFDYAGTYALDAFTGDVIWSYPEGGASPAVADGIVFTIGCGRVYAFGGSEIPAGVRIEPETLNLDASGVFTAFITLLEGYDGADIDVSTVKCEDAPALSGTVSASDSGTLVIKFDRADLVGVPAGNAVRLSVTGELTDGTRFEGSDTVRVIAKGT
ncbi:MAG: Outer membrane protein assembly factor BamB [Candidatus Argoarchaeum ethanivorans]|uniref:Outer membrane protein assembly factor BamB n=1 Tax=Candidatus Argoarchaeum ethanivorans TaxID=2608793 RepID=A0A811T8S4_9EURY|nr:MAG: Outer membrane protein assembly factor BamB [Candidatus Argoarchaeum ethanivorans]